MTTKAQEVISDLLIRHTLHKDELFCKLVIYVYVFISGETQDFIS